MKITIELRVVGCIRKHAAYLCERIGHLITIYGVMRF